jgi:hypothetical protein
MRDGLPVLGHVAPVECNEELRHGAALSAGELASHSETSCTWRGWRQPAEASRNVGAWAPPFPGFR